HLAIGRDEVPIQEGGLTGIGLLLQHDPNADQLGLIAEHVHKPRMRQLDKMLLVLLAQLAFLFPVGIFTDDERADAFSYQQINDPLASRMQVVIHAARSFVSHALHANRPILFFGKVALQFGLALVVVLIEGFERSAVNKTWDKPNFVCSYS